MEDRKYTWPVFRRVWRRAALFEEMAKSLNINVISASKLDQGNAISCAHDRCFECRQARECRNWLEDFEDPPLPPDFCPNREFFARCEKSVDQDEEDPQKHA